MANPTFTASPIVSAGGDPGVFDASQLNSLNAATLQQNLQDRATYRAAAPGLLTGDLTATGQALGANPTATQNYLTSLPAAGQNVRAQADSDQAASGALAAAALNAPPDQRAAVWTMGRQALINGGHQVSMPADYPGDAVLQGARNMSLPVPTQLDYSAQIPSVNPVSPLRSTPGGGYVGPGGAAGQAGGGITSTPLGAPGYTSALATSEGGNNPSALNAQGYAGQFQFGTGRLTDLGMYQPAQGEDPNSNAWKGTLSIPGYPNVKTLADFRGNISAQNAVQAASRADIGQAISQTPGAQSFDPNGLQAVAHLGGVAGMQKFVATNGAYDPADSNGTHLSDYYRRFSSPGGQQPAARVQTASAANSTGMQPTATDASAAPATPALPISPNSTEKQPPGAALPARFSQGGKVAPGAPVPGTPDPGAVVSVDNPASAVGLPAGTPYRVANGLVQTASSIPQAQGAAPAGYGADGDPTFTPNLLSAAAFSAPATAPQPTMTPAQAVQQANQELGPRLASMQPDQANAAVQARAQQILSGQSGQVSVPAAAPSTTPAVSPLSTAGGPNALSTLGSSGVSNGAQQPNALAGATGPSAPAPAQPNALSGVGQPQPGSQGAPAAPQAAYPFLRMPKTMGLIPVPEQPGYAYAQGPGGWVAQRIPGAPGKGTTTTAIGGTAYVKDDQTGQVLNTYGVPNTARTSVVNDGNAVHIIQPGTGEIASVPLQAEHAENPDGHVCRGPQIAGATDRRGPAVSTATGPAARGSPGAAGAAYGFRR